MNPTTHAGLLLIGWLASVLLAFTAGGCKAEADALARERDWAYKCGCGYYRADPKTGEVKFVYIVRE